MRNMAEGRHRKDRLTADIPSFPEIKVAVAKATYKRHTELILHVLAWSCVYFLRPKPSWRVDWLSTFTADIYKQGYRITHKK